MAVKNSIRKGEDTVSVIVPKDPENRGNDSLFVNVNGRKMVIKRGVKVTIPKPHAAVIRAMERQKAAADRYIEEHMDQ